MKPMKQLGLAEMVYQRQANPILEEKGKVVPWSHLEGLIEPVYPKKGSGRPPMPLGTMLQIRFMQQWFSYSDPAME